MRAFAHPLCMMKLKFDQRFLFQLKNSNKLNHSMPGSVVPWAVFFLAQCVIEHPVKRERLSRIDQH